uniref:CG12175 n=1 Tax=Macrostomum lignano TaxID=282301 RepID=A0A1I8H520_9PLAT
ERRGAAGGGSGTQRRAGKGGLWNGQRRPTSLSTPLEEEEEEDAGRSLKTAGSSDGVLVSFHSGGAATAAGTLTAAASGNGARAGKSGGASDSSHKLSVRDKNYDFNEDEPRS